MVSIIIPVYNGEQYLKQLWESLMKQTYKDFEVIFVNDGSSDNSFNILNNIALHDARIKIINQENHGICASRNAGIMASNGKYLIFFDQDDSIELNLVEKYYEAIAGHGVDLAVFGKTHYYISDGMLIKKENQHFDFQIVYNKRNMFDYLFNIDNKKRLSTIWNCIYKKEILEKYAIKFDEYFKHGDEDGMFNIEYILHCQSILFSDKSYYHYYIRKNQSTITKKNDNLLNDYLHYIEKLEKLTSNYTDGYVKDLVRLYNLRFFSNVYKRYCRFNFGYRNKKKFIEYMKSHPCFMDSLRFSNKKYFRIFGKKYFYWDLFNYFCKNEKFFVSVLLLEIIQMMKKD